MKPPCKECTKRYLGCHDTCEDYKEWHEWMRKRKFKPNQYYRSTATSKLYQRKKGYTYKNREMKWMKNKH